MTKPDIHVDVHLVLLRDGHVLMGERRNTEFAPGQYHVPAGRLEADESIVEGIIREAKEETGIAIAAEDVGIRYVMHIREKSDRLSLFFSTDRWSGEIENREPEKCAGWEWVPVSDMPPNTVPYAKRAILDLMSGKQVGLFGW